MKHPLIDSCNSVLKLINVLAWYTIVIAGAFYLLPMIGLFLEERYDALAQPVKLISIIGFFAATAWWQMKSRTERFRETRHSRSRKSNQVLSI